MYHNHKNIWQKSYRAVSTYLYTNGLDLKVSESYYVERVDIIIPINNFYLTNIGSGGNDGDGGGGGASGCESTFKNHKSAIYLPNLYIFWFANKILI